MKRQRGLDGLRRAVGVARRMAQADQKPQVTRNAVANLAKARQIHEEPLLEERRKRIIQVREFRKSPKVDGDLRFARGETEKIRQHAESLAHLGFESWIHNLSDERCDLLKSAERPHRIAYALSVSWSPIVPDVEIDGGATLTLQGARVRVADLLQQSTTIDYCNGD